MLLNLFQKTRWLRAIMLFYLLVGSFLVANAQYFDLQKNRKHVIIPFHLVRNMVVIQLKINDKGPFNFVLDTGVGLMIITEPSLIDSINLASKRLITIPGLGEGEDHEAYATSQLNIIIPGLISNGVSAVILKKDQFNLSSYVGMPIHGLLGYEFFNNLAVKIDFGDSTLNVCRPKDLHAFRKSNKIPISIEERKPYLQAKVTLPGGKTVDDKMVIDIGAGHPISIENMIQNNGLPTKFIQANLGVGLNGPINGFLSRVDEIDIGKFKIKNVISSFPDNTKEHIITSVPRDGSIGIGMLKKFTVIFDYADNVLYLKPGPYYDEPFEHDMSGMEYYSSGDNYQHVIISRVETGSAADMIGLEKGDEIVSINLKPVNKMSLEQIDALFKSRDGRSLLLEIYHDKKYDNVVLTLKRRI